MAKVTLWQRLNTARYPLKKVKIARNGQASAHPDATTFYLRYTEDRIRKKEPVGSDLLEALNRMKIVLARLAAKAAGIETAVFAPQLNPHAALAKRPITELASEYEARIADKAYKTKKGYMKAVNRFTEFMVGKTLGDCDRDAMIKFRQHLARTLKSGSYIFNTFLKVVMFLNDVGLRKLFAEDDWLQSKDWPVNVDKKEAGTKRYDTYTRDEIAALLSVADCREKALVLFLISTGFRISEARDTTWELIDFRTNEVLAPGKQTKDKQSRWEPLATDAVAAIKEWNELQTKNGMVSDYVFPAVRGGRDFHLTERTIVPLIERANAAGFVVRRPKKPSHGMRVAYATMLSQNGTDLKTIQESLGHEHISTTQIYLRSVTGGEFRRAVDHTFRFTGAN
jgi:integrase